MSSPYQPYPQGEPGGGQPGGGGYGQQQPGYGQPAGGGGYGQSPYPQAPMPQGGWEPEQRSYLRGGPVGFGEAIAEAFKNVFTYSGRASRSAFWWFYLFSVIVNAVFRFIPGTTGLILDGLVGLVMFFTTLSLAARRLHDADHSAYWLFMILLPIIGWIWLLVYYVQDSTPGPNRYDEEYA